MTTTNLSQQTDALIWASEFVKTVELDPSLATDEGAMIGWFANAIMAGYDEARRKYEMVNLYEMQIGMCRDLAESIGAEVD